MINKATLMGRLGMDPELRYTSSGTAVCNFSLATSKKYKTQSGESKEETQWHNITAWGKLAEICAEYLSKGSLAYVEGEIQYQKWEDRDGNTRDKTIINITTLKMLGGKNKKEEGAGSGPETQGRTERPPMDEDIPF